MSDEKSIKIELKNKAFLASRSFALRLADYLWGPRRRDQRQINRFDTAGTITDIERINSNILHSSQECVFPVFISLRYIFLRALRPDIFGSYEIMHPNIFVPKTIGSSAISAKSVEWISVYDSTAARLLEKHSAPPKIRWTILLLITGAGHFRFLVEKAGMKTTSIEKKGDW